MTDVLQPSAAPDTLQIPTHMTWEEYLAFDFEDCQAEWVDGEVVLVPPARAEHQFIAGFLYRLIIEFVELHSLGLVFQPPMLMSLSSRPSGREPDVLFVASEHVDRVKDALIDGPADLAVEVVSPDSDRRDRAEKFQEYEAGGVSEYWLIDGLRKEAYFYVLGEDGRYHLVSLPTDGIYRSKVLDGLRLKVDWLWRVPELTLRQALAEIID